MFRGKKFITGSCDIVTPHFEHCPMNTFSSNSNFIIIVIVIYRDVPISEFLNSKTKYGIQFLIPGIIPIPKKKLAKKMFTIFF